MDGLEGGEILRNDVQMAMKDKEQKEYKKLLDKGLKVMECGVSAKFG